MSESSVSISLSRFLLVQRCPDAWKKMDLYLFRDESVVFYVGQSQLAFSRVWDHLIGGFHGHSIIGRFVWCNWPRSMRFTIELMDSRLGEFADAGMDRSAAEAELIKRWSPCFNVSLNKKPVAVPASYLPVGARLRGARSLSRLIHQAERVVMAEDAEALAHDTD
jgi:hypothetical protein